MKDYNTPEEVSLRANQDDPIVMYIIVNENLNMSIGKACAQCAHASQMLQLKYQNTTAKYYDEEFADITQEQEDKWVIFQWWLEGSFRKIVLKADDKEFIKVKNIMTEHDVLVVDAGLTEIPSGSETVIGLWPMHKSKAPKIIKKLQVLK